MKRIVPFVLLPAACAATPPPAPAPDVAQTLQPPGYLGFGFTSSPHRGSS